MTNIVSIVVPVYNPEISLLERAVQSVLKQNYINYELLLINDGSTDSQVLSYLEKQSTVEGIRVLHQKENRGVAEARNRGIREAIGDWVAFLDQDDYYCPDFLSGMMQGVENSDTDMRMAGFYLVRGEQRKPFPAASGSFASPWLIWSTCAIWSRIYRRRALLENAVAFPQGCYTEDMLFVLQCNSRLKAEVVPKWLYNNWISDGSTSRSGAFSALEMHQLPYSYLKEFIYSRNPEKDRYVIGYLYNELALLTCILIRNSSGEVCRESVQRARELVDILSMGRVRGEKVRFLEEYLKNAELDRKMKLVILGLFHAFSFHTEGVYCMLVRKALRVFC